MEHQFITFKLQNREFGVDIHQVKEIVIRQPLTEIPGGSGGILGVINLRGNVITIVDLTYLLQGVHGGDGWSHIIVVENLGEVIGVAVDEVSDVLRVDEAQIEPGNSLFHINDTFQFLTGVAKLEERLVMLLDIGAILQRQGGDIVGTARG